MPPIVSIDDSVVTSLSAVNEQRLDVQLRQLEFHALLHRKLDLQLLLESFLAEGQGFVRFDGSQQSIYCSRATRIGTID